MSFKEAIDIVEDYLSKNKQTDKIRLCIIKILQALKKQVPISPKVAYIKDYDGIEYVLTKCPCCNHESKDHNLKESFKRVYCINCGQRFD